MTRACNQIERCYHVFAPERNLRGSRQSLCTGSVPANATPLSELIGKRQYSSASVFSGWISLGPQRKSPGGHAVRQWWDVIDFLTARQDILEKTRFRCGDSDDSNFPYTINEITTRR